MIKKDNQTIGAIYKGSTPIEKIYKGSVLVWEGWKKLIAQGIPPLTLTKCKENKLLNYQVYGNSKQGELPYGYTQVEYLETDGNAYINLNETATIDCEIGLDCYAIHIQGTGPNNQFYMGCRSWGLRCAAIIGVQPNLVYQFGSMSSSLYDKQFELNKRHKIVANNTGCYIDGSSYYSYYGTMSTVESTNHIKLFATSQADDTAEFKAGNGFRVYSAYVKKKGVYTVNLVPCYRNSDSKSGMYDLVTGTFYTNAGTGTFTTGPEILNPDNPIEIESVGDNETGLPLGYTQLDYIESTGTQYIDTGISQVTPQTEIEMDFKITEAKEYQALYCSRQDASNYTRTLFITGLSGFRNDRENQIGIGKSLSLEQMYNLKSTKINLRVFILAAIFKIFFIKFA